MSDPSNDNEKDNDHTNRSIGKSGAYGNLFEIIDMIVFELNRTKRMFIVMILSVMIIASRSVPNFCCIRASF